MRWCKTAGDRLVDDSGCDLGSEAVEVDVQVDDRNKVERLGENLCV